MLSFQGSDYISIEHFELLWRFTDPKYVKLSASELAEIKVLSSNACHNLHSSIMSLVDKCVGKKPIPNLIFEYSRQCDVSGNHDVGRSWLESVLPQSQSPILISWNENLALETNLLLFIKYWDDFCYPSSDDTTIVPFDLSWIIQYWHEEVLFFASRK